MDRVQPADKVPAAAAGARFYASVKDGMVSHGPPGKPASIRKSVIGRASIRWRTGDGWWFRSLRDHREAASEETLLAGEELVPVVRRNL